jgi:hypothetical protein
MPLLKRRNSTTIAGVVAEVIGFAEKVEKDSSSNTYFTVQCSKDGSNWTVEKRFSEFHSFENDLHDQITVTAPFPPKLAKFTGLSQAQKEERRLMFNEWITDLLRQPHTSTVIAQIYNFFEVMANIDLYESQSSMQRHTPGRVLFEGYITKLGGNKEDPYNLSKGTWTRRYMVLQDDLRYYVDETTWRKGGNPKGVVSLDNFFVTAEKSKGLFTGLFTIHALPWPLICRADDPSQAAAWVEALEEFAFSGFDGSMINEEVTEEPAPVEEPQSDL